jgi:hypothetical protein
MRLKGLSPRHYKPFGFEPYQGVPAEFESLPAPIITDEIVTKVCLRRSICVEIVIIL